MLLHVCACNLPIHAAAEQLYAPRTRSSGPQRTPAPLAAIHRGIPQTKLHITKSTKFTKSTENGKEITLLALLVLLVSLVIMLFSMARRPAIQTLRAAAIMRTGFPPAWPEHTRPDRKAASLPERGGNLGGGLGDERRGVDLGLPDHEHVAGGLVRVLEFALHAAGDCRLTAAKAGISEIIMSDWSMSLKSRA